MQLLSTDIEDLLPAGPLPNEMDHMAHIESLELWAQQLQAGSDLGNWYFSQDGTILLSHRV